MGNKMQEMLLVFATLLAISNAFNTICPSVCTCKWKNGECICICVCIYTILEALNVSSNICLMLICIFT